MRNPDYVERTAARGKPDSAIEASSAMDNWNLTSITPLAELTSPSAKTDHSAFASNVSK